MEQLSVCRMCLADDVPLQLMENKYLQTMFEKMTDIPFVREDRPVLACYICCARLHNCYKFRNNCIQSEELLQQTINSNVKFKQLCNKKMLSITKFANISCSGVASDNTEGQMEGQTSVFYNIEVKKEIIEGMKKETNQNSVTDSDASHTIIKTEIEISDFNEYATNTESEQIESSEEHFVNDDVSPWSDTAVDPLHAFKYDVPLTTETTDRQSDDMSDEKQALGRVMPSQIHEDTSTSNNQGTTTTKENLTLQYLLNTPSSCSFNPSSCSFNPLAFQTAQKQRSKANNARRFECNVCNKQFTAKWSLSNHTRMHTGEKPYKCNICSKSFNDKRYLIRHNLTHTGEKPYECNICIKRFTDKSHLRRHNRTQHADAKPNGYECDVCRKRYTEKSSLLIHMRVHTGDKPFKCDICSKCFSQSSHLKRHNLTHTGRTPKTDTYVCEICGKRFTEKSHLVRHNRVHTGEKPFKCNICSKSFSQTNGLVNHRRTHTAQTL